MARYSFPPDEIEATVTRGCYIKTASIFPIDRNQPERVMKTGKLVLCLISLMISLPASAALESELLHADRSHCSLRMTLNESGLETVQFAGEEQQRLSQEGMYEISNPGEPALIAWSFALEIPATSDVRYDFTCNTVTLKDINLTPAALEDNRVDGAAAPPADQQIYSTNALYPAEIVNISEPAIMRNHRLVQVTVTPYQYNPVTRELIIYTDLELDFQFSGVNPVNQINRTLPPSPAFEQMLSCNVLNYEAMQSQQRDRDENQGLDPILYIYNSAAGTYIDQLLEWKRQRGHVVYEATEADLSLTSSSQVLNYIQQAYDDWDNPPVFVTLVGDPSSCSFGTVAASNSTGDHNYSRMEGNDILADIFVGRMSVANINQLQNVVNKQMSYESTPYADQLSWFDSAHLVGDDSITGMSAVYTSENIKYKMERAGLDNVTTCYNYLGCTNEVNSIITAFNDGILYFNYRGYLGMSGWNNSQVSNLNNGYMLPLVVTITCGSGDFVNGTGLSEGFYQGGTTAIPRGSVAAIGTATTGTHTRYNNVVDLGIYGGIFDHDLKTAGEALFQGKFELWLAFNSVAPGDVSNFSSWNNLMGDASLALRTDVPEVIEVVAPATLPGGATALPVTVSSGSEPVAEAMVTLYRAGTGGFQISARTDASGQVVLPLAGNYLTGTAVLTVSGTNLYPSQGTITLADEEAYVDIATAELDDDNSGDSSGNDDGLLNPGETIELRLTLDNLGTEVTATGISVTLNSADPRVEISQGESSVPDLAPGGQNLIDQPLVFNCAAVVDPQLPPRLLLTFAINTDQGVFDAALSLSLVQPLLTVEVVEVDPTGDGVIDPEETAELFVELNNLGDDHFPFSEAVLTCSDPWLSVINGAAGYDVIAPGANVSNSTPFVIQALEGCFNGQQVPLQLTLTTPGPGQIVDLLLEVGTVESDDPFGPVAGIYYCFDSEDRYYTQHPLFSWLEINAIGTQMSLSDYGDEDDDSEMVLLPFDFTYFDTSYDRITICSNGWCALGDQENQVNYRNYPIPTAIGPAAMIAPFWDDLRVSSGGGPEGKVFYHYDEPNHRFIIEWYDLTQVGPGSPNETFQVVLYDQDFADTDNGDILFQYQEVHNNTNNSWTDVDYATVGIESPDQTEGLQYSYWNSYPAGATPLQENLAVRFTQERGGFSMDDIWAPVINHVPSPWQEGGDPYEMMAVIVDDSEIASATLFWSYDEVNFVPVTMENSSADNWVGEIPGQEIATRIYYYFHAIDASDNSNETTTPVYTFFVGEWLETFADDMEQGEEYWYHNASPEWYDQWHLSSEDYSSASHSWKCGDTGTGEYLDLMDARLFSMVFPVEPESRLRIQHRIEAETSESYPDSAYDGGVVEISLGDDQWQLLPALTGGYNKHFRVSSGGGSPATHPFVGGTPCFSGELDWQESTFSLFDYVGETVQLRFRFGSDQGVALEGWYIDDVVVEHFFPADAVVGADQPDLLPQTIELSQNYPNPFNPTTTIEYALRLDSPVRLAVFNLRGQQVMTLVDEVKPAGRHTVQFDGAQLASGLYFYRLEAKGTVLTRKMMLVR
jgi:hypothetical protein